MRAYQNTLPASWPLVPLGAICEVGAGNGAPQGDAFFAGGKYLFVRMQDVGRCQTPYIVATADRLNDLALEKHNLKLWPAGSLLIPKSGASVALNKRALLREPSYVVSHLAVLVPGKLVDSEYLYYLTCTLDMMRLALDPAYPSLRTSDLARLRIPLPPISEQRRIVEILQEAEEIRRLRAQAEVKTAELIPAMFRGIFGEISTNSKGWPIVPVSHFVESFQGGKSLTGIDSDFDQGRPRVLKISAVTSGYLVPSESKALPSNYEPPEDHFVKEGDLLITRANTEELVGATALVLKGCPTNLVLPDKIWRFVWKQDYDGTPEFVWAMFQEKATRSALGNIASGTGGSMKNIGMAKLLQMRVVWPPKKLQQTFSAALREVLELSNSKEGGKTSALLQASLSAHAFSGQLTERWRAAHKNKLAREIAIRDEEIKIRKGGPVLINFSMPGTRETPEMFELPDELNREQLRLLMSIRTQWARREFDLYFTAEMLGKSLDGPLRRNPHVIESHLAVLAARGLIIPVSREEQTGDTGEYVFGTAYRLPQREPKTGEAGEDESRVSDHARLRELERLAAQLEKERALT